MKPIHASGKLLSLEIRIDENLKRRIEAWRQVQLREGFDFSYSDCVRRLLRLGLDAANHTNTVTAVRPTRAG